MIASVPEADPPKLGWRIVRLFRPHRAVLALIVAMILVTSVLSVISALLVRQVFDKALFVRGGPDLGVLYPLVAALVAIPIINGILNIVQVYLTEVAAALTPVFVLFSRRVGRARRIARREAQASLASMGSITQETLSVLGILLAKVFGHQ